MKRIHVECVQSSVVWCVLVIGTQGQRREDMTTAAPSNSPSPAKVEIVFHDKRDTNQLNQYSGAYLIRMCKMPYHPNFDRQVPSTKCGINCPVK